MSTSSMGTHIAVALVLDWRAMAHGFAALNLCKCLGTEHRGVVLLTRHQLASLQCDSLCVARRNAAHIAVRGHRV